MVDMLLPHALPTGTVLQTSGGTSLELVLLIGLAAIVVIAVAWLLTRSGGSS